MILKWVRGDFIFRVHKPSLSPAVASKAEPSAGLRCLVWSHGQRRSYCHTFNAVIFVLEHLRRFSLRITSPSFTFFLFAVDHRSDLQ